MQHQLTLFGILRYPIPGLAQREPRLMAIRLEDIERLLEFAKASQLISSAAHQPIRLLETTRPGTAACRALGAFAIMLQQMELLIIRSNQEKSRWSEKRQTGGHI